MGEAVKILFIHPFLYRYARGIERYTFSLSNALAAKGAHVSILTWHERKGVQLVEPNRGVKIYQVPQFRYYVSKTVIPFYLFHLLSQSYDVIVIHFAGYGEAEAIALARALKQIRYNIVFHFPHSQVPHRYQEFLKFDIVYNASKLIAVSQFVAGGIKDYFGAESAVIGHGVDTKRFLPNSNVRVKMRQELGISPQTPVIVTAAALEERKGMQWVIQALPDVLQEFPDARYYVLGDGHYRPKLEDLVKQMNLQSHVFFLGSQTNVEHFYQLADVSLLLSHGEASSLTSLESIASELPVIVSQHPPFHEIIRPNCGWMVNESNPAEVAIAVKRLLRDEHLRQEMGKAGRQYILAEHTWEKVADQYMNLFYSQLDNGR